MDLAGWLALLKQNGPTIGILVGFIIWQTRTISKLLDRHEKAYRGEIERMHEHHKRLLDHLLGPQPSSQQSPTVKEMLASATQQDATKEKDDK